MFNNVVESMISDTSVISHADLVLSLGEHQISAVSCICTCLSTSHTGGELSADHAAARIASVGAAKDE